MKIVAASLGLAVVSLSIISPASAVCNEDDHHPENGGYFFVGVAGVSDTENLDSAHGQKHPNATWAPGIYYPYGQNVLCNSTAGYCAQGCDEEPGCGQFMSTHTCAMLMFCPPEGMTDVETVHEVPSFEAADTCDFSEAKALGVMNGPGTEVDDGCFLYTFEDDHELREYYFVSEEGCEQGQKIAVKIEDFAMTADACKTIGLTTPRIRNCDCRLQKTGSALGEPCRTAFSDTCAAVVIEEGDCCETETCISIYEDYDHPEGKAKEDARVAECKDEVPGLCYNENGNGTDTNRQGSTNCCTHTCSSCGIKDSATAQWKQCTALDAEAKSASCGFLSRYDGEAYQCNYTLCEEGDHWNTEGEAYLTAFDPEAPSPAPPVDEPSPETPATTPEESTPSSASVLHASVGVLLSSFVVLM